MATGKTKRKVTKAEQQERFDEALHELPDNYLACRDMRHAWNVAQDYHVSEGTPTRIREIRRVLTCLRGCGVVRVEKYLPTKSRGLDKTGQTYLYPKGDDPDQPRYQIPGAARGNKRSALIHSEQYRRFLETTAEVSRLGERRRAG